MAMPLKALGMDLYSDYCAAAQMLLGHSARFVNDTQSGLIYPYPIGGVINNYGSLAVILMAPFTHFSFDKVYGVWSLLSICIIFFLVYQLFKISPIFNGTASPKPRFTRWLWFLGGASLLLILSGPINLLLERGQLEVLVPLLLFFVFKDFLNQKESKKTAVLLGLAIHLKVWPLALSLIFLRGRRLGLFALSLALPAILTLTFNPWLSVVDWLKAMHSYSSAASQMIGWANVSLYSLIQSLLPSHAISWKFISIPFYGLMILVTLYVGIQKTSQEKPFRGLFILFIVAYSLLTPGFICDYTMIIFLPLLWISLSAGLSHILGVGYAILLSNLLVFHAAAGPIKSLVLILLLLLSLKSLWKLSSHLKQTTAYSANSL
jgi:hypothetical protein